MFNFNEFYMKKKSILLLLLLLTFESQAQEISDVILKKIRASEYKLDLKNEDGVFVAKNKKSGKWGMYQAWSDKDVKEMIPPVFDSIDFFEVNAKLTGVWKGGKSGIFLSPWSYSAPRQTVDCLYDDYSVFEAEKTYVAVKKDGLWAWIDWMSGELKTGFLYDLGKEKMPTPLFEQQE